MVYIIYNKVVAFERCHLSAIYNPVALVGLTVCIYRTIIATE